MKAVSDNPFDITLKPMHEQERPLDIPMWSSSMCQPHAGKEEHLNFVQPLLGHQGAIKMEVDLEGELRSVERFYPGGGKTSMLDTWAKTYLDNFLSGESKDEED